MSSLQAANFPFDFKVPSLNVEAMLETHRKNAAALTTANQVAFDGLKALAERQGELIKTTVDDYSKVASDVLAAASFEERATKQADAVRQIYASTVARFRELSDIALKANVATADILNARVTEAFDEFKALFAAPVAAASAAIAAPIAVVAEPVAVVEVPPVGAEPVVSVEPEPASKSTDTAAPTPVVAAPKPAPKTARRPTPRR